MALNVPTINPFSSENTQTPVTEVPLDVLIKNAIKAATLELRVWLPASIVKIYGNQLVDIQPLLQTQYYGQSGPENLPIIQQVAVQMPNGTDYSIKIPIAVGDTGIALFCDRSLDVWLSGQGQIVDPSDTRQHDYADPIFIPGLVPFSKQTTDSSTDLILTNGSAKLKIQKAGTFALQNGTQELITNLVNLVQILTTANTVAGGPFTPDVTLALNGILTNLQTLEG